MSGGRPPAPTGYAGGVAWHPGPSGTVEPMDAPILQQTGPESFELFLGDGQRRTLRLAHHTRRGLGLSGVPPLHVATEAVRILQERGERLAGKAEDGAEREELDLGAAVGRDPAGFEELRVRLS